MFGDMLIFLLIAADDDEEIEYGPNFTAYTIFFVIGMLGYRVFWLNG